MNMFLLSSKQRLFNNQYFLSIRALLATCWGLLATCWKSVGSLWELVGVVLELCGVLLGVMEHSRDMPGAR